MQQQREATIALWFEMWLQQQDLGIDRIFTENVIYIESWGPKYTVAQRSSIGLASGTSVVKYRFGQSSSIFIKAIKRL